MRISPQARPTNPKQYALQLIRDTVNEKRQKLAKQLEDFRQEASINFLKDAGAVSKMRSLRNQYAKLLADGKNYENIFGEEPFDLDNHFGMHQLAPWNTVIPHDKDSFVGRRIETAVNNCHASAQLKKLDAIEKDFTTQLILGADGAEYLVLVGKLTAALEAL